MGFIKKENKKKQAKNEYFVRYYEAKRPIIADLVEDRAIYTTPIAHTVFGLMEMMGVESIGIKKGKEMVKFLDTEASKLIRKQLGYTYVYIMIRLAFRILRELGIDAFERNIDSSKWNAEFTKTDKKLLEVLKKSIEENIEK